MIDLKTMYETIGFTHIFPVDGKTEIWIKHNNTLTVVMRYKTENGNLLKDITFSVALTEKHLFDEQSSELGACFRFIFDDTSVVVSAVEEVLSGDPEPTKTKRLGDLFHVVAIFINGTLTVKIVFGRKGFMLKQKIDTLTNLPIFKTRWLKDLQ